MIEVVRPCFSPACRGELYKQRIPCDLHPDSVDCSATCAERLASSRSQCLFCGEWNEVDPPEGDPYRLVPAGAVPDRGGAGTEGRGRGRGGLRDRAGAGNRKRRRGRPGRKKRKKGYPGRPPPRPPSP